MGLARKESGSPIGSHNCASVTHFTSAFYVGPMVRIYFWNWDGSNAQGAHVAPTHFHKIKQPLICHNSWPIQILQDPTFSCQEIVFVQANNKHVHVNGYVY